MTPKFATRTACLLLATALTPGLLAPAAAQSPGMPAPHGRANAAQGPQTPPPPAPRATTPAAPLPKAAPAAPAFQAPKAPIAAPRPAPAAPSATAPAAKPAPAPTVTTRPAFKPAPGAAPGAPSTQAPVVKPAPTTTVPTQPAPRTAPAFTPAVPAAPATRPVSGAPAPYVAPATPTAGAPPHPAPVPGAQPLPAPGGQPPAGHPPRAGRSGLTPAQAIAIGAAAGVGGALVGGFIARDTAESRSIDDVRRQRRVVERDGAQVYFEQGRTIVRDGDGYYLRHDVNDRFRRLGGSYNSERRGDEFVSTYRRPNGDVVITYTDASGNLLRRVRRMPNGTEIVIIENHVREPRGLGQLVIDAPPPPMRLARDRYIVMASEADEPLIYETLTAPPVAPPPRAYSLEEIRYSPAVRAYTRSIDINSINFDSGAWTIPAQESGRLAALAKALNQAIARNPREVFLIEGHTDAVGAPVDNLSLSDRRAEEVATVLTRDFNVPPENLTTQGYGEQNLKVQTQEASRENRRVVVRRITPLLTGQN
jgi:outer membrane protein OmpA-like peptidoglycan-associated protein